jgi:hypothetical protein
MANVTRGTLVLKPQSKALNISGGGSGDSISVVFSQNGTSKSLCEKSLCGIAEAL